MSLYAYFDEAGHPSDPNTHAFTIAGCVADVEDWKRFDREWSSILAAENVRDRNGAEWFHWRAWKHGKDAFNGWSADRRESLLSRLIATIQANIELVVAAFRLFDSTTARERFRREYLRTHEYAVRSCLAALDSGGPLAEPVTFVFAHHPEINPTADHDYLRSSLSDANPYYERLGNLVVSDPREKTPLQAADLVASEIYAWLPSTSQKEHGLPRTLRSLTVPFHLRGI